MTEPAQGRTVTARIEGAVTSDRRHWPNATLCRIGQDVRFSYARLERYCLQSPSPIDVDLLVVAGVVAHADRSVPRHRSAEWSRSLELLVPVHEPDMWKAPAVQGALRDTLSYLTGDEWRISFVKRAPDKRALQLPLLKPTSDLRIVLPYSGGLDSFAEFRRLRADHPDDTLFLVTTEHTSAVRGQAGRTTRPMGKEPHRAGVPIRLAPGRHPEQTYRTRTFLFYVVSALAWKLARAEYIAVPETGQGAIGPSLAIHGNEHPYRSTHPGFTKRLERLLNELWGQAPRFEHPHLWITKGQLLRQLHQRRLLDGFERTSSCPASLRRKGVRDLPAHCGVCAACLLRRMALSAALGSDGDDYVWRDLRASTIEGSMSEELSLKTTDNDRNIAVHGVLCHQHLADVGESWSSPTFAQTTFEVAEALKLAHSDVTAGVAKLVEQHLREWGAFLSRLPESSWVVRLLGGD